VTRYTEIFEKAHDFAKQALAKMSAAQVPATPDNYNVWYAYVSGINPELTRSLDILTTNGRDFTEELNHQLYEEFFADLNGTEKVLETSGEIEHSVQNVVDLLQQAGDGAASYSEALNDFTGSLQSGSEDDLRGLISGIITQTQDMQAQNERLKDQLASSSGEIARLREDLEAVRSEAMTDALTGIGNRKSFDATLRENADASGKDGSDLCLLLLDIDHFKEFNDTYGHQLGDQVLRLVAQGLKETVTGRQTPARYGGEEFAIVLPEVGYEEALKVADAARLSVGSKKIVRRSTGERIASITVSVGVSLYRDGEPLTDFIKRADDALYAAKRAGRNRVIGEAEQKAAASAAE